MDADALARIIHEEVRAYLNRPDLFLEGWCDDCDELRYFRRSEVVGDCPGWWELEGDEREVFLSAARAAIEFLNRRTATHTQEANRGNDHEA